MAGDAWKKPRGPIVLVLVRGTMRKRSWNRAERREERVDDTGNLHHSYSLYIKYNIKTNKKSSSCAQADSSSG